MPRPRPIAIVSGAAHHRTAQTAVDVRDALTLLMATELIVGDLPHDCGKPCGQRPLSAWVLDMSKRMQQVTGPPPWILPVRFVDAYIRHVDALLHHDIEVINREPAAVLALPGAETQRFERAGITVVRLGIVRARVTA